MKKRKYVQRAREQDATLAAESRPRPVGSVCLVGQLRMA